MPTLVYCPRCHYSEEVPDNTPTPKCPKCGYEGKKENKMLDEIRGFWEEHQVEIVIGATVVLTICLISYSAGFSAGSKPLRDLIKTVKNGPELFGPMRYPFPF